LIWQIEPILHKTIRKFGVPIISVPPKNMALMQPYIDEVGVDVIVTIPSLLLQTYEIVSKAKKPPFAIVVIHSEPNQLKQIFKDVLVLHELHFVPGLTLAYQDVTIAKSNDSNKFHISDSCLLNIDDEKSTLVSASNTMLPKFKNLPSSFLFEKNTDGTYKLSDV